MSDRRCCEGPKNERMKSYIDDAEVKFGGRQVIHCAYVRAGTVSTLTRKVRSCESIVTKSTTVKVVDSTTYSKGCKMGIFDPDSRVVVMVAKNYSMYRQKVSGPRTSQRQRKRFLQL